MSAPLCRDCQHFSSLGRLCRSPHAVRVDIVTGARIGQAAEWERNPKNECGPGGNRFAPRRPGWIVNPTLKQALWLVVVFVLLIAAREVPESAQWLSLWDVLEAVLVVTALRVYAVKVHYSGQRPAGTHG